MQMADENEVKSESCTESPTSVLEDEEVVGVNLEEEIVLDSKNGDSTLISSSMIEEEEKLMEIRMKKEEKAKELKPPTLNDTQFTKLDELLNQTQLYSEFLLEKIDEISTDYAHEADGKDERKTRGRGRKRKASTNYNNRKAKRAVEAMLTRSKEDDSVEDMNLTEEERLEKEQAELVPLLTGGKLKPYQIKGVKWLIALWQNGLNGILADQMGLGKTIQTIGFLAHLKGKGLDGPYLVIAPLSTLSNWVNEIERFAPSMNVIIYHGNKKERDAIRRKHMPMAVGPNFPIVITSYEMASLDARKCLRHYNWKYLVVDEGHRLKNSKCLLVKQLKFLHADNKLLLTGTPLQNNLAELWSLLNFILPQIFKSIGEFESWFDLSGKYNNEEGSENIEEKRKTQVVAKLHAILRPFLLRRMKSEVEKMLPRKKEIIIYANMTEHQKNFEDHLINKTLDIHLREKADTGRGIKAKLNNLVLQLRKNCNHPDLLESAYNDSTDFPPIEQIVEQCGKFQLLERLLKKLFAHNHKVLIFSQWAKILDIIGYYLSEKGFETCRIDGTVKLEDRRRQIKEFNDENSVCRVFLLSTRAGGLGINLTSADTCILYDSDWNPQMDLQAMDRCHRIGQTKPVHVYRLATAQSVETKVLKRAFSKLKLESVVIGKGQFHEVNHKSTANVLKEEELIALLKDDEDIEDQWVHTNISDEDLDKVMDRSDLVVGPSPPPTALSSEEQTGNGVFVLPLKGPGWEVVVPISGGGMLSAINN